MFAPASSYPSPRFVRRLSLLLTLALLSSPLAPLVSGQNVNLDEYEKSRLDDLPEKYRKWLQEDVRWLITSAERDVYLRLPSDLRRDRFVEEFWRVRDPSPGTEQNEYFDQHYERFAYAEKNFGKQTSRAGFETDRGRMWILLGKPQSTTRLPSTSDAVPSELWFYSVDPALGVPPFFYLIFFRDRSVGDYRLYSPAMDGPMKLLNVSGQQRASRGSTNSGVQGGGRFGDSAEGQALQILRDVDQELALAASNLVPGEGGAQGVSPLRSEMVLARVLDIAERLMPDPTWAYRVLTGVAESTVRFASLPMQSAAIVLIDPTGVPFIHYAMRTPGERLNLNDYDGHFYVTFQASASVRDTDLRFVEPGGVRTLQADVDEETVRRLRGSPVQYMDRLPAISGDYTLGLVMENNVTREFAQRDIDLHVPELGVEVGASEPLLVLETEAAPEDSYDAFASQSPFQVGSRLVVPALGGPFAGEGKAWVFRQIYPGQGQEGLSGTYSLSDGSDNLLLRKTVQIDPSERDSHGVLNHLVEIDLRGVPAGEYGLRVELDADAIDPVNLPVRVVDPDQYVRPYYHLLQHPPASDPEIQLQRAEQLRTVGRTEEAIAELDGLLQREPDMAAAVQLQIALLTDARRYERIEELLAPRLVKTPNNIDLLLELGAAEAELGEHYDAIRYFERARLAGAEETAELLNALASEYYAQGRFDHVIELLQRSLTLDAEQPQMRRLLDEVVAQQQ